MMIPTYARDPEAIYRQSFATIAAETDFSAIPPGERGLVTRLIHTSGMTDLVDGIVCDHTPVAAGRAALAAGAPILVDARMVAAGILTAHIPAHNRIFCALDDPAVPALARKLGNTRSAAAVETWRPLLAGAVVAIGNAPTALFHLLEMLEAGAPRPAVILGFPVGFVGAAESKDTLITAARTWELPFVTVRGRRGGSALAAAAVNALLVGPA